MILNLINAIKRTLNGFLIEVSVCQTRYIALTHQLYQTHWYN